MQRLLPLLLLGCLAAPAFAAPVAILRWDVCDDGSPVPRNKDFVAGPVSQVVSARGLSGTVRGVSVEIEVRGSAGFGDAWRFDAAGCNAGAVSFSIGAVGKSCPAVNSGQLVVQSYQWDSARGTARVRLASSLTGSVVLDSTRTYVLGRVTYDHTSSVPGSGPKGTCGGADLPMCFELLSASYIDEGGAEHSFALGNQTLTWQDAAQTSNCFVGSLNGVRLDEFMPTCGIADTTVQYLELRSSGGDHYSASLHIRIEDHLNTVTSDRGDLFGAGLEDTPWPANSAWLLGTAGFATVENFTPDVLVPAVLDPVGGKVTLYDGRPGGRILQVVAYGPGTFNPIPPVGQSLERQDDSHYSGATPSPASSAGAMPNAFACNVGNERVVIREVLPQCANGGTGGQFIELEAPIDQRFQEDMRLVVKDRDGSIRFSVSHLFSPQNPGATWPAGRAWLLGPGTFAASAGIAPDRIIGSLDPLRGSIELYGGPGGSLLVDHLDYGAGTPNPGGSLERIGTAFVPDYTPSPTNFAGSTGGSDCYCPGPLCADASVSALRIDEVALRCANGTTTTQFVELRSTGADQSYHGDLRLRVADHDSVTLFDAGNLFPGRAEGEAWPNGAAWLLALGGPAGTELTQASGIVPDAVLPVTLDPVGGSITLYDGRSGGVVVHALAYGPIGRGESLQRGPGDVFTIVATQEPENRTGAHAGVTACPCGTSGIALGTGAYVYSTDPAGQSSLGGGTGAYDLHAGTVAASATGTFSARGAVKTSDLFLLNGPNPGQEIPIRATLHVTGSAGGGCTPIGHCSSAGGAVFLRSAGASASAGLGNLVNNTLVLPLVVRVGEPFALESELIAAMEGTGAVTASASYMGQIAFLDFPSGMSVTSCAGFVLDGPTAALPSIVAAGCDDGVVHLEWSIDHALVDATVERTELGDRWQSLGAPEVVGDELARYDDRGVEPGKRYGYRLSWSEGEFRQSTEVAWVDVQAALALRALSANPSPGTPTLEFTLPKSARVRIEVLDLRGRRVESRDLGMQEPGAHRFEPGAALSPGVYWARLIVEGREERLKLVVLGR